MRIILIIPLIIACGGTEASNVAEFDSAPVAEATKATQPEPLVALVEQTHAIVGTEVDCPAVETVSHTPDALHERWTGGCTMSDGTQVKGDLERFDGPNAAWVVGNNFRLQKEQETTFMIDGAVTLHVSGNLWLVEAAASVCGLENWMCTDGFLGLDLSFTLYPAQGFPNDYDTTVSGVVATNSSPLTVDGAWSINSELCEVEPVTGLLTVSQGDHHSFTLNGAFACDGCGDWQVQGQPTPGLCGIAPR
ncbi:MAG: hypothetical protein CL930_01230 [Deltaproteobacteria bacterium]|nr:hypothetical protein [Deltaproteobacteria bacterium]